MNDFNQYSYQYFYLSFTLSVELIIMIVCSPEVDGEAGIFGGGSQPNHLLSLSICLNLSIFRIVIKGYIL